MAELYPPEGFAIIADVIRDAVIDLRYYGTDNIMGKPANGYCGSRPVLTIPAAEGLRQAAEKFRALGYRIVVYDSYRPLKGVQSFVDWAENGDDIGNKRFYPELTKLQILDLNFFSRRSAHSRGSAIDLSLCDMQGRLLDMGSEFDFCGSLSAHGAPVTPEQAANRELLKNVMVSCGFKINPNEWWHYMFINEPYPDTYFDFDVR